MVRLYDKVFRHRKHVPNIRYIIIGNPLLFEGKYAGNKIVESIRNKKKFLKAENFKKKRI
jgi:exo-beta-1,3-glucanase (GH17 family)